MKIQETSEKIVCRFCNLHGGLEASMQIISEQFKKVGADPGNLSKEELREIIEALLQLLSGCKPTFIVEQERKEWHRWLKNTENT